MTSTKWAFFPGDENEDGEEGIAHVVGVEQEYGPTITVCGRYLYGEYDFDADAERCEKCTEAVK